MPPHQEFWTDLAKIWHEPSMNVAQQTEKLLKAVLHKSFEKTWTLLKNFVIILISFLRNPFSLLFDNFATSNYPSLVELNFFPSQFPFLAYYIVFLMWYVCSSSMYVPASHSFVWILLKFLAPKSEPITGEQFSLYIDRFIWLFSHAPYASLWHMSESSKNLLFSNFPYQLLCLTCKLSLEV